MKIQHFTLWTVVGFFLIIGVLSSSFYYIERSEMLRYLSETLNQNIFRVEEELQKTLQHRQNENIQIFLDQGSAIDDAVQTLSLSLDGKTIAFSSSRSLSGKIYPDHYLPITHMAEGLIHNSHLHYWSDIPYFDGPRKEHARLLIDLDEDFVFARLKHIALFYGTALFLVLGVIALGVLVGVKRFVITPLQKITQRAKGGKGSNENHLIEELTILDKTLCTSFDAMQLQQEDLTKALYEAVYLDGILRTVADINQFLITAKTTQELMSHSCIRLAEHPGYDLCFIALKHESSLVIKAYSKDSTGCLYPEMVITSLEETMDLFDPIFKALHENTTVVLEHLEKEHSLATWRFIAEKGRFGSMIALPLVNSIDTLPLGVVTLYAKRFEGFEDKEIAMLEELAGDIGFAIHSFLQREQLQYHLTTDTITNLPNRFSLVEALSQSSIRALAIINIDRFSDINEVYGVTIGDAILSGYAHWLQLKIQSQTSISLYKMGSDEYALVYTGDEELRGFLDFLNELIIVTQKETFIIEGIEVVLTITVGVAPASFRVLEHATAALKQAKQKRHSIELFSVESKQEQENNIAWYKRIKEAIEEERIVPYFQPIVDNQTGEILKYEALIRLIEHDGKVIAPFAFLDIAKKTKLYPELTKIMIDKVIQTFQSSTLPVSLNLSIQDLINPDLADYLEKQISQNGVAKQMIFEILESEGIENYDAVSEFVDRFKSIGCRFAIDDFGSGYSNFDHLLKLNIDTLKIDGSLIKNLPHDRNAQIFVKHISDFAHEMGISVVAEFVANEEIYLQVKAIGIDASQGYFFFQPTAHLITKDQ